MGQDLWNIVIGDMRPKPAEGATDEADAEKHVFYIPQTDFRRKDQQAMAIIVGRLTDFVFPVIQHLTDDDKRGWAKGAWDTLRDTYAERGFNYKSQLITELATLSSEGYTDVQGYANYHLELCRKIVELGGLSLDDFSPAMFLNGLGSQYALWVTGARSRARRDGPPKVTDLVAELVDEERLVSKDNGASIALLGQGPKRGKHQEVRCPECNKLGHTKDSCWQLHPELIPSWISRKNKATKAAGSSSQTPGNQSDRSPGRRTTNFALVGLDMAKAEVTSVALQSLGLENNWFIDNGANSHFYRRLHLYGSRSACKLDSEETADRDAIVDRSGICGTDRGSSGDNMA